jgi:hypothetical protein
MLEQKIFEANKESRKITDSNRMSRMSRMRHLEVLKFEVYLGVLVTLGTYHCMVNESKQKYQLDKTQLQLPLEVNRSPAMAPILAPLFGVFF